MFSVVFGLHTNRYIFMFFFRESVFNVRYTVESSSISITSSTHSTLEQSSVTAALQVTVCKKKLTTQYVEEISLQYVFIVIATTLTGLNLKLVN